MFFKRYKLSQMTRNGKSLSRFTGHMNIKGDKEFNVSLLQDLSSGTSATVLSSLTDNNRNLIEINAHLKEALVGSYTKITQTMG